MNFCHRVGVLSFFAASLLSFSSCGDDKSSSANALPDEVANKAELKTYECNMSIIGEKIFVNDLDKYYECDGEEWFESYDQPKSKAKDKSSSSSKKNSSSSSSSSQSDSGKSSSSKGKSSSSSWIPTVLPPGKYDCSKYKCVSTDYLNPNIEYGELLDERDNQVYRTVKIGEQNWMAQNLNFNMEKSWCFNNDTSYCAKYGRLYDWPTAMDSVGLFSENGEGCGSGTECYTVSPVRGVCPEGWHLPGLQELNQLIDEAGGKAFAIKKLKATAGWVYSDKSGTDDYGFSVIGGAYLYSENRGKEAKFWAAFGTNNYKYGGGLHFDYWDDYDFLVSSQDKSSGHSIRCIENLPGCNKDKIGKTVKKDSSLFYCTTKGWIDVTSGLGRYVPKDVYLNPEIKYDSIIDERDNQVYKTVKIGEQVWLAQNLNYSDSVKTPSLKGKNWCFNNNEEYCNVAGRLYTWAAAIDSVVLATDEANPLDCGFEKKCNLSTKIQGICPKGWHLPDTADWNKLKTEVGKIRDNAEFKDYRSGMVLKSQSSWFRWESSVRTYKSYDSFGFSAISAGRRYAEDGGFDFKGSSAYLLSSTEYDSKSMYLLRLSNIDDDAELINTLYKSGGHSVRCIKD